MCPLASWDRMVENHTLAGGKQWTSQLGGLNLTQHTWGKGWTERGSGFPYVVSAMGTDPPPQTQDGSRGEAAGQMRKGLTVSCTITPQPLPHTPPPPAPLRHPFHSNIFSPPVWPLPSLGTLRVRLRGGQRAGRVACFLRLWDSQGDKCLTALNTPL